MQKILPVLPFVGLLLVLGADHWPEWRGAFTVAVVALTVAAVVTVIRRA